MAASNQQLSVADDQLVEEPVHAGVDQLVEELVEEPVSAAVRIAICPKLLRAHHTAVLPAAAATHTAAAAATSARQCGSEAGRQ